MVSCWFWKGYLGFAPVLGELLRFHDGSTRVIEVLGWFCNGSMRLIEVPCWFRKGY